MGLEPTRHRHTHLKRACLPIPALPQIAFDCKKDSSTFGGIKSSPILYLFSYKATVPTVPIVHHRYFDSQTVRRGGVRPYGPHMVMCRGRRCGVA